MLCQPGEPADRDETAEGEQIGVADGSKQDLFFDAD